MTFRHNANTNIASTSGGASNSFSLNGAGDVLYAYNSSNLDAYIKTGIGAQTATTADMLVPSKQALFLLIDLADDTIAIATPSASNGFAVARGTIG